MKKFQMSRAEAEAHQRRHGFMGQLETFVARGQKAQQAVDKLLKPKMTQTEREFSVWLEARKRTGEIDGWTFGLVKLKLADKCWYTPDFITWVRDIVHGGVRLTFIEIKGKHIWDDAKVKYRVAKEQVTWADWEQWQKIEGRWTQIG